MLKQYTVSGFKSFESVTLNLGKLNLFAGANSAGKSTAIQALLFAADNLRLEAGSGSMVSLHTPPVTFNEIRNYLKNSKEYGISLSSDDDNEVALRFTPADDAFQKTRVEQEGIPSYSLYGQLCRNLLYLPATRTWQLTDSTINRDNGNNPLGLNGEYIIDFYYNHHEDLVPPELTFFLQTMTLEAQVNYWLFQLTGYRLAVEPDSSRYKVKFITKDGKELLPYHVGTGISFITEVVITCLSLKQNGLVIVENPEIHLHPSAQADLIDFFARIAKSGRQVIIESHSDHLFNGIRRLLHNEKLAVPDVSVYNFVRYDSGLTSGNFIYLNQFGGIDNYEPGMFEQFDKDLDEILK